MQLGGRLDYDQPARHARTVRYGNATRKGTRPLKRFSPQEALRLWNPANRFGGPRAERPLAKNVLATLATC